MIKVIKMGSRKEAHALDVFRGSDEVRGEFQGRHIRYLRLFIRSLSHRRTRHQKQIRYS